MKNLYSISLIVLFFFAIIQPASCQTIEFSMVPDDNTTLEIDHTRLLISDSRTSFISGIYNF